ncbi:acetolactate synthase, large subunit [Chitinophaga terrae (ex Kim and Jung 2007)]|uniref:Acetolactate synthase n=1 Tax=Chitinophaga terrae (ex Kim and Jung 2007) TaxID=408074 RepID=A0A1H4C4B3_9BACT|nr:biosynthetic-type acetolactate synthase large subunit [Chitinophaga terrae (ex Kim and Jung 2007)]GEP92217.1 acetolactate synthase [Chitinophaga terrae (ex Kim and Jung 2007)]SEA55285.1 acetolactate synthase, large subunit [Chitinophaga terrae (ex Kim and Jung 2007)]
MQQKDVLLMKPEVTEKPTAKKPVITGSEAVIRSLIAEGVETIFGYPGGAIMPIYDALYDFRDKVHHILVRHEQGATHAAQGYARSSGKVGVAFATSGPGATNLVTGLADAFMDSTPIVCITGQVAASLLGTDAFQETDVIGITMPITKWNIQVTRAEDIPAAISKAFYIARTGRPGPVLVDITKNAQTAEFEYEEKKCEYIRSYQPRPVLNKAAIADAAALINEAKKPFILCGHGVLLSNAEKDLIALAEKAQIPMGSTLLGLSAVPVDHPLYVGLLGMHGNYAPNMLTGDSDVIIAVGMRFDDRVTGDVSSYVPNSKVIHIEIDAAEINKIIHADVPVHADAKEALQELLPLIKPASHESWLQEFREAEKKEYEKIQRHELHPTTGQVKMAEVVRLISEKTNREAILVTDVGQHQMVASRYYRFKNPNTNITSGGMGTMGFSLPAAMGAKMGAPDKQVVAVIGDGCFQMTLQELGTIYQSQIGVKIVILNNNFLGMVRQWQQLFFDKRYSSTEMINPDFIQIAKGFFIPGQKVTEREKLSAAIDEMLAHDGAYLLEVVVEQEDNVFPMVVAGTPIKTVRLE